MYIFSHNICYTIIFITRPFSFYPIYGANFTNAVYRFFIMHQTPQNHTPNEYQVLPTAHYPLVVMSKETDQYATFDKYWIETGHFEQTLVVSRCKQTKREGCKFVASTKDLVSAEVWSKPTKSKEPDALQFVYLNPLTGIVRTHFFQKPKLPVPPEVKEANYAFANDPTLTLSSRQARILWYYLDRQDLDESKSVGMLQFVSNWPGIDKLNKEDVTLYNASQFFQETIFPEHPTTIEEAIAWKLTNKQNSFANHNVNANIPPTLSFVPNQPHNKPTQPIFIQKPTSHTYTIYRYQPSGNYTIRIIRTEATGGKKQREIAYATPLESSEKNPNREPFALCPLTSTVAILFWDSNTESPTYGQPIVVSINSLRATPEELEHFTTLYGEYLSDSQRQSLTLTNHTHKDTTMQYFTKICKYCGTQFETAKDAALFCQPKCRIDFHAGKVYGEDRRKVSASNAAPTQATEERLKALEDRLDQLLIILTSK